MRFLKSVCGRSNLVGFSSLSTIICNLVSSLFLMDSNAWEVTRRDRMQFKCVFFFDSCFNERNRALFFRSRFQVSRLWPESFLTSSKWTEKRVAEAIFQATAKNCRNVTLKNVFFHYFHFQGLCSVFLLFFRLCKNQGNWFAAATDDDVEQLQGGTFN